MEIGVDDAPHWGRCVWYMDASGVGVRIDKPELAKEFHYANVEASQESRTETHIHLQPSLHRYSALGRASPS